MSLPKYDQWLYEPYNTDEGEPIAKCDHCGNGIYEEDKYIYIDDADLTFCSIRCLKEDITENLNEYIDMLISNNIAKIKTA